MGGCHDLSLAGCCSLVDALADRQATASTHTTLESPFTHSEQGSDELAEMLLNAHEIPGDKFYVFAMRNVFAIPADLRDDVEEALVCNVCDRT